MVAHVLYSRSINLEYGFEEESLLDYEQHDEVEAPVAAIPVQNAGCF